MRKYSDESFRLIRAPSCNDCARHRNFLCLLHRYTEPTCLEVIKTPRDHSHGDIKNTRQAWQTDPQPRHHRLLPHQILAFSPESLRHPNKSSRLCAISCFEPKHMHDAKAKPRKSPASEPKPSAPSVKKKPVKMPLYNNHHPHHSTARQAISPQGRSDLTRQPQKVSNPLIAMHVQPLGPVAPANPPPSAPWTQSNRRGTSRNTSNMTSVR